MSSQDFKIIILKDQLHSSFLKIYVKKNASIKTEESQLDRCEVDISFCHLLEEKTLRAEQEELAAVDR